MIGFLFLNIHFGVELGDILGGEGSTDFIQDPSQFRTLFQDGVPDDRCQVVRRPYFLVILQERVVLRIDQLAFRRIGGGNISLIIFQDLIFQRIIIELGGFPVEFPIGLFQGRDAVFP